MIIRNGFQASMFMKLNMIGYSRTCLGILPYQPARLFATENENSFEAKKTLRFSSFSRSDQPKSYAVDQKEEQKKWMTGLEKSFEPKKEFSREGLEFDPNIRLRMDKIPNELLYRGLVGKTPDKEPQSCYVAVNHKGRTWHLFNAARFPLGRMATLIATYIRGKHKPTYSAVNADVADHGDVCVVVNAAKQWVPGKKLDYKLYHRHTGYPGGLRTTTLRKKLERDPEEVVYLAVKGMIPKNNTREKLLRQNLIVHAGPYHPHHAQKLPQFTEQAPIDINEQLHLNPNFQENPEDYTIIYESHPEETADAPELKGIKREYDESLEVPPHMEPKTHTQPKINQAMEFALKRNNRRVRKKYRQHK